MKELAKLIRRLNRLVHREDWPESFTAATAALELWRYPSYEKELTDAKLRDAYLDILFKVADIFQYYGQASNDASALLVLKRAYSLDDGLTVTAANASYKEV